MLGKEVTVRRHVRSIALFAAILAAWLGWRAWDARPVLDPQQATHPEAVAVYELFTSEGCSSCPPADELLAEVAQARGVYALAFHVDYWDQLGWADPYGQRAFSLRQRTYAARLSEGQVYTPQVVINGTVEAIGSSRSRVRSALATALAQPASVGVTLLQEGERLRYRVEGAPVGTLLHAARILPRAETVPERGENAERAWTHANVVLELATVELDANGQGELRLPHTHPVIAWAQDPERLTVIGATRWDPPAHR